MKYFVILAVQQTLSILIPSALVCIGHFPMICILLKSLREVIEKDDNEIHILVRQEYESLFKKELKRWFPFDTLHIFAVSSESSANGVMEWITQHLDKQKNLSDEVYILQSDFPLLSSDTLRYCMRYTATHSERPFAMLAVNKTLANENRGLLNVVICPHSNKIDWIQKIPCEKWGFLPFSIFPVSLLYEGLPLIVGQSYTDIVRVLEEKPVLIPIQSYVTDLDTIQVISSEDKNFAEHKFLEKQYADWLLQTYSLWTECKKLDQRIDQLEKKLESSHNSFS